LSSSSRFAPVGTLEITALAHETAPGRTLVQAKAELARTRESVALSMSALEGEIARTLDWREWVRRRPAMTLALAVGLGILLEWRR